MSTAQSTNGRKSSQKLAAVLWIGTILFGIAVCIRAAVVASHVDSGGKILGDHFLAGLPIEGLRGEPIDGIERSTQMMLELARQFDRGSDLTSADEAKVNAMRGSTAVLDFRLRWNYQFDLRDVGSVMWRVAPIEHEALLRVKRVLENEDRKANWVAARLAQGNQPQYETVFAAWSDEQWRAEKVLRQEKGWSITAVAFAAAAWLLVIVGLAATAVHRILKIDESRQDAKGFISSMAAWWLAFFITFCGLGLLVSYRPAIRDYSIPELVIAATLLLTAIVAFFWSTARFVRRQGRLPSEERSRLFNAARLAIVLSATFLMIFPLLCVADRKVSRGIAVTWREFPGNLLEILLRDLPIDVWGRNVGVAFLQWGIHGGLLLTAALWVFVVSIMAWRSVDSAAASVDDAAMDRDAPTWRSRWCAIVGQASRTISRSSSLLAILMFALCLAAATQWLVYLQEELGKQTARLQNPAWLADEVAATGQQLPVSAPKGN
jgi:hypothetical protein